MICLLNWGIFDSKVLNCQRVNPIGKPCSLKTMFTATMWLNHPHSITPSIQMVPDGDRVNSKNESCGNARGHLGFQMFFLLLPFFGKTPYRLKFAGINAPYYMNILYLY